MLTHTLHESHSLDRSKGSKALDTGNVIIFILWAYVGSRVQYKCMPKCLYELLAFMWSFACLLFVDKVRLSALSNCPHLCMWLIMAGWLYAYYYIQRWTVTSCKDHKCSGFLQEPLRSLHTIMLPPPCFTVGVVLARCSSVAGVHQTPWQKWVWRVVIYFLMLSKFFKWIKAHLVLSLCGQMVNPEESWLPQ